MPENDQDKIELTDLLADLRDQLAQAKAFSEQRDSDISFELQDIEVEINTVVSTKHNIAGKASTKWFVLSLEAAANAEYNRAATQTLRLKIKPKLKDAEDDAPPKPLNLGRN